MNGQVEVKFYTGEWCSQCKMVKPQLVDETYTTVDVDTEEGTADANANNIKGLPTLIKFVDGVETARVVGNNIVQIKGLFDEGLGV